MAVKWMENGQVKRGPSWNDLVRRAAFELGAKAHPELLLMRGTNLQVLEYFRVKFGNTVRLQNWLYGSMRPPDADLGASEIHAELAKLDLCNLIYTTNFDDFIERSLSLHGRPCHVIAKEADMDANPDALQVIKFHGDLNNPSEMVLSETHYEERLSLHTAMDYRLRADILNRAVLFIGYSFNDPNVAYLFRLMNNTFKGLPHSRTGRRAYITVADPSDFEITLFQERNIHVIPVRGTNITQDVAEVLRELRS